MLELEHALLSTSKQFVPELKHKHKSVEQTPMQRETEEIKLRATGLPVKPSVHLQQTESQRTESITLHQLVVLIPPKEFRQIVELHRQQMQLRVVVKQIHVDQRAQATAVERIELTVLHQLVV